VSHFRSVECAQSNRYYLSGPRASDRVAFYHVHSDFDHGVVINYFQIIVIHPEAHHVFSFLPRCH